MKEERTGYCSLIILLPLLPAPAHSGCLPDWFIEKQQRQFKNVDLAFPHAVGISLLLLRNPPRNE